MQIMMYEKDVFDTLDSQQDGWLASLLSLWLAEVSSFTFLYNRHLKLVHLKRYGIE